MANQYRKKREEGFTIIEVLIVLAIAGLILLVVFLAVPALQRNGRNTAIKNDVQNLLGGVSEYMSNNDGKAPNSISGTGDITITDGTTPQTTKLSASRLVTYTTQAPTPGNLSVSMGQKCGSASTMTTTGATSRSVAVLYHIETSSGTTPKCQES
ncbi:type II secretion system protein [Candidatus Saccharibacteria bacterium]|nr:type II secretion system protein [Candidatus Saccharibacteria bacterium]